MARVVSCRLGWMQGALRMLLYLGVSDFCPSAGVRRARTVEPKGGRDGTVLATCATVHETARVVAARARAATTISAPGLEELLSPLGFALAAALEGTGVSLYFQGPAVRVLVKGFTQKLHGPGQSFSRFARPGEVPPPGGQATLTHWTGPLTSLPDR